MGMQLEESHQRVICRERILKSEEEVKEEKAKVALMNRCSAEWLLDGSMRTG